MPQSRFPIALYLHWTPRETGGGWAVFCLRDPFSGPKWLHLTVGLPADRRNRKLAAAITTEPPRAGRPYISTGRHNWPRASVRGSRPTSTVGPGCAAIARRAASEASCNEVSGFCTLVQLTPFCWRRAMTFDQQEPSANSP